MRARRVAAAEARDAAGRRARGNFALIESTFTDAEARAEALRCVQCTTFCDKCVEVCPNRANYTFTIAAGPLDASAAGRRLDESACASSATRTFRIAQNRQILHVDDFCNECDNCQTFCVHQGRPYVDKPRLFLDRRAFEAETDNAFRIEGALVRRRERGVESRLFLGGGERTYDDDAVRVTLDADWRVVAAKAVAPWVGERSLRRAAEMAVLFDGVTGTLPFLLLSQIP